jgi:hypothetical protein
MSRRPAKSRDPNLIFPTQGMPEMNVAYPPRNGQDLALQSVMGE